MRYFFNTADTSYERDAVGQELASLDEARRMAVRYAGEVLRDQPEIVWTGQEFRVEVTDASGLTLFTVVIAGVERLLFGRSDRDPGYAEGYGVRYCSIRLRP